MSITNSVIFLFKIIIPAYYSLKFIKQRDSKHISNILKFWCLNSVWTLFEYLIPLVVDQWFFFFANLAFYAALTFPNYSRSTTIFDTTLSKIYTSNQELITEYANKIESGFDNATGSVTNKIRDFLSISVIPKLQFVFEKTIKRVLFSGSQSSSNTAAITSQDQKLVIGDNLVQSGEYIQGSSNSNENNNNKKSN